MIYTNKILSRSTANKGDFMKKILFRIIVSALLISLVSCASGSKSKAKEEPLGVTTQTNKKDTPPSAATPDVPDTTLEPTFIETGIDKIEEPGMMIKEETTGLSDSLTTQTDEKQIQLHQIDNDPNSNKSASYVPSSDKKDTAKKDGTDDKNKSGTDTKTGVASGSASPSKANTGTNPKNDNANTGKNTAGNNTGTGTNANNKNNTAGSGTNANAGNANAGTAKNNTGSNASGTGNGTKVSGTQPRGHIVLDNAQYYVVKRGDVLIRIAKHFYGSDKENYFPVIIAGTDEKIEDADVIEVGQQLTIPDLKAILTTEESRQYVKQTFYDCADTYEKKGKSGMASQLRAIAAEL